MMETVRGLDWGANIEAGPDKGSYAPSSGERMPAVPATHGASGSPLSLESTKPLESLPLTEKES